MKRNNKPKGSSLVEILISVFLIGLLATCLLVNLIDTYKMMTMVKEVSMEAFSTMDTIEAKIQSYLETLSKPDFHPEDNNDGLASQGVELFKDTNSRIEVTCFPITFDGVGSTSSPTKTSVFTAVGLVRIPQLPVPKIKKNEISIATGKKPDGIDTASYAVNHLFVTSNVEYEETLTEIRSFQWYVSRTGFTTIWFETSDEEINSTLLPSFPTDYQIIPNETRSTLTVDASKYSGRHLVLAATPVSDVGKIGNTVASNPVYISALPQLLVDPQLHLDGGLVTTDDLSSDRSRINRWYDFAQGNDAEPDPIGDDPKFEVKFIGSLDVSKNTLEPVLMSIYGQYVIFEGTQSMVSPASGSGLDGLTVFVVARPVDDDSVVYSGDDWSLGLGGFTIGGEEITPETVFDTEKWFALGARVSEQDGTIRLSINEEEWEEERDITAIDYDGITIGGNSMSVVEVLIYNEALYDFEYSQVFNHLLNKYGLKEIL